MLSMLGKSFSRQHFEMFFIFDLENSSLKETVCMKCQSLFSAKNKRKKICLSSAEIAQRVAKVNEKYCDCSPVLKVVCAARLGGKFQPRYLPVAFAGIYRSGKYSSSGKYWQRPAN